MKSFQSKQKETVWSKANQLPEGWSLESFSNVVEINSNTLSAYTPDDYSFYYLSLSDVNSGVINHPAEKICFKSAPDRARRIVKQGDILLSTVRPNLQGFGYVDFNGDDYVCSTGFAVLRPKTNVVGQYLYQFLYSHQVTQYFYSCVVGSNYPAINNSDIERISLPLPPIDEQKKISQILSTWDRAIERVQRLIEAKQRQKKGLMQVLLTGRLRFPEFGEPVYGEENIPCGWKAIEFHDCATRSKKKIDPVTNGFNFRCVELEHISQETGKIIGETESKQQTSSKNYFRAGNVLFGKLRPYLNKFAFCDFEGVCSSEIWVLQNKSICTSRYLFYLVQTDTFLSASSQTTGTKMPRSDWNVVKKTKFALPNLEEQERITALLDQVEQNIELLERYVLQLKQQKKGLMQKLLTGEIRVKVE